MMLKEKKYKLDLFDLLNRLNKKEKDIWSKYSDEERKQISPFIIMRWLSGTTDKRQIIFLNELVNKIVFDFSNNKELLLKLLAIANSGIPRRYFWLKQKSVSGEKHRHTRIREVVEQYYSCSPKEAKEYLTFLEKEDIIEMCETLGMQKEEIQLIKKEY